MTRRQMGIGKSYLKHSFKSNLGLQTQEKRAKTGFAAKGKKSGRIRPAICMVIQTWGFDKPKVIKIPRWDQKTVGTKSLKY